MQLQRLDTSATVTLPDDYYWSDEHAWNQALLRTEYSLTGALIAESSVRQAGRPITLEPINGHIWVDRATVETLRAWAAVAGLAMQWTHRGVTRDVLFRGSDLAVEAEPLMHIETALPADWSLLTLRLIEI